MATFSIDLITGKPYLFSGDFTNSGMTTFSGVTSVINGLSMVTSRQARLGGTLVCSTILTKGAGNTAGVEYGGDYSASFSNRSLVDKGYVDNKVSGSTPNWNTLTNRPAWLTGTTLSAFQLAHTHSQYLTVATFNGFTGTTLPGNYYTKLQINSYTGETANALSSKLNTSVFNLYTGTTAPNKYQTIANVSHYTGTTAPNTYQTIANVSHYTGTTAPNQFASKANATTGATNLGSGTGIYTSVTANKIQLKGLKGTGNISISTDSTSITLSGSTPVVTWNTLSGRPTWLTGTTLQIFQTGHTHSYNNLTNKLTAGSGIAIISNVISATGGTATSWAVITNKPSWLSGNTLQQFQTGHTHSYNNLTNKLSGGTGVVITNNVINVTGSTSTTYSTLQLLDTTGGLNVNTIAVTPVTWVQQVFSGTSLSFTGGSRIYVRATGVYEISYALNIVNGGNSVKNIGSVIRKNTVTDITPLSSSSLSVDLINNTSTNSLPQYLISLSNSDYLELVAFRIGNSGTVSTKANGSWLKIKRIS